jgi:hypothetical protein
MREIIIAFNNKRGAKVHLSEGEICDCLCDSVCLNPVDAVSMAGLVICQAKHHSFKRSSELWEKCLCPKPVESDWHDIKCLRGECSNCGFQLLPLCNREVDAGNQSPVAWRRFEKVLAGKNRKGELKKVIRLEYKSTNTHTFLQYAMPKVQQFIWHQHVARWQDSEFKSCLADLGPNQVISLIDFAENYSFKGQDKIQSQHWFNFQLTILVHIMYSLNPDYDVLDKKSRRLKIHYFYYISDDRKHDTLFVQYCLSYHWRYLNGIGMFPWRHTVWSDGCAAQFKGARSWFYVAR